MATPAGIPNHPAPGISQFLVQVYGEDRAALPGYAIKQGYGADVSDFMSRHLHHLWGEIQRLVQNIPPEAP